MPDKTDHDLIVEMHAALFDKDGNPGLCSRVEKVCRRVDRQDGSIRNLWIAITVLGASVGGGSFAAVRLLLGG